MTVAEHVCGVFGYLNVEMGVLGEVLEDGVRFGVDVFLELVVVFRGAGRGG